LLSLLEAKPGGAMTLTERPGGTATLSHDKWMQIWVLRVLV
jgi:hypothetical protein